MGVEARGPLWESVAGLGRCFGSAWNKQCQN
jgi:hypothetical protein